jgi:hypothetical protein
MKATTSKEGTMTPTSTFRELDRRSADGIVVTLLWNSADGNVHVDLRDVATGEGFRVTPPRERALDAFHHPFAYAAHQGIDHTVGVRRREPIHA